MSDLGGWTLGDRMGAGGMGTVYRATRGAETAALKVINPGLAADEAFRRRFRREVDVSRMLFGPHTARVIDFDLDGETPWLATVLLDGPTVTQAVDRDGPLPPEDLLALAQGLARGLVDLHAAGIVHRDVKPSNVIITSAGAVLVDFGVAAAAEFTAMTATGLRLGSSGWMSPEQVEGCLVTSTTDVFSWGLTVAYAATGHNPYGTGPTDALLYRIAHHKPDLSAVPTAWVPLLRATLAHRPEDRPTADQLILVSNDPGSASALLTIEAATQAETAVGATRVSASPIAPAPPRGRRGRRLPRLVAACAALVILTLLLGAGIWILHQRQPPADAAGAETEPTSGPVNPTAPVNPAAPPHGAPSATAPASAETGGTGVPLIARDVDPGRPRELAAVGKFFASHIQEDVRVDIDWVAHTGTLEGSEADGLLLATPPCFPYCDATEIQAFSLTVHGLSEADDVTFSGLAANWRSTGTFFVQSATVENSGVYQVVLRVTGTKPVPTAPTTTAAKGRCDVLDGSALHYPGAPLSTSNVKQFSPHVLLVQDVLNFQRGSLPSLPCLREDGYFGAGTVQAVRLFQGSGGLEADGVVGPDTYAFLMLTFEAGCHADEC